MPIGRPSLLTPEIQKSLVTAIRRGVPIEFACDLIEINSSTYRRWMKAGRKGEANFQPFFTAIKKARAQFINDRLKQIRAAGKDPKTWTASAWMLERLAREYFAKDVIENLDELKKEIAELKALLPKGGGS